MTASIVAESAGFPIPSQPVCVCAVDISTMRTRRAGPIQRAVSYATIDDHTDPDRAVRAAVLDGLASMLELLQDPGSPGMTGPLGTEEAARQHPGIRLTPSGHRAPLLPGTVE